MANNSVYRSTQQDFDYHYNNPIATVIGTNMYTDPLTASGVYYYQIVGINAQGYTVVVSNVETAFFQTNPVNNFFTSGNITIMLIAGSVVVGAVIIGVAVRIHRKRLYGF
jgi:hypothetical protein